MTDVDPAALQELALEMLVEHGQAVRAGRERLCASCLAPVRCPALVWARAILGLDETA